uniref:Uncharacterized protein n=2 Tax=Compsopogon caeruleus TaxID=31354 RepID=A0A7S1TCL7_9RHOD|mmetsp:Transcript_17778/g.36891  ORF Transcript_17778/g.36891 Transcript_17778/m.36891 type:complete len:120 (+) Transcript_17778:143-502(+)
MAIAGPLSEVVHRLYDPFEGTDYFFMKFIQVFALLGIICFYGTIIPFELNRRRVNVSIFKIKNPPMWYILHYLIMTFNLWLYCVIPYVISSFRWVLCIEASQYRVAEKQMKFNANRQRL